MYLLVLLPILIVTAVCGVLALMHENPDRIMSNHEPFDEIERTYKNEIDRVA